MTPLLHRAQRKLSKLIEPRYYHDEYYGQFDDAYYSYTMHKERAFPSLTLGVIHSPDKSTTKVILLHGTDTTPSDWLSKRAPYFNLGTDLLNDNRAELVAPYLVSDPLFLQKLRLLIQYRKDTVFELILAQQIDNLIEAAREEAKKIIVIGLSWGATIAKLLTQPTDLLVLAANGPSPADRFLRTKFDNIKNLDPQHLVHPSTEYLIKDKSLIAQHKRVMLVEGVSRGSGASWTPSATLYMDFFKGGHTLNPDTKPLLGLIAEIADA